MNVLTAAEEKSLNRILGYIEDYDSLNMSTYDNITSYNSALLQEMYYTSNVPERYCYRDAFHSGDLYVNLKDHDHYTFEDMRFQIYPMNRQGEIIVNFNYLYDESTTQDEWYEKKPNWFANFSLKLFSTEEEYFQASTVEELPLTMEENDMFIKFINDFNNHVQNRIQEYNNG